ncbi:MAG TPA: ferredoxin, partial [Betaproteobacteria bacterium]|nr:ferredoxin [Betaproteobacteria bacterium]
FVLRQQSTRPLLFIAGNSGFAPIKSLVEHAIALDRTGSITLYWIGSSERDLYMRNRCRAWADALDNFHFTPFVADSADFLHEIERIAAEYPQLSHADIYVAGPEALVGAALQVLPARGAVIGRLLTEAVY